MESQQFIDDTTLQADLRQYMMLLWRWAWLIILAAVLAGGAAYITSQFQQPVYQATTTLLINEASTAQTSDYTAILTSERLARTYSEMLTKRPVLDEVLLRIEEELGLELGYEDIDAFKETITVQLVRDTQLIEVSVENTDPDLAALIANTLVEVFTAQNQALQATRFAESKTSLEEQLTRLDGQIHNTVAALDDIQDDFEREAERTRLEAELTQYRQTYSELLQSYEQIRVSEAQTTSNVVQVEPAIVSENPIRPRVLMNTALAFVVGGMLAVGVIFLIEALDDTLKSPDDVSRHLQLPILGTIIRHDANNGSLVARDEPRSPSAEAFRSLRTNIQYASVDYPIRSLLITSPSAGAGKSTVSANLGTVMVQGGKRVVIVDADMRRPRQHEFHKLENRLGLSSLFMVSTNFDDGLPDGIVHSAKSEGLEIITAGKNPPNPSELLASEKMSQLIRYLSTDRDVLIVDSPPLMAVTDAAVLAPRVDGVLLVVQPGETRLAEARNAVEQLRRVGANLIGVVINEVDPKSGRYGYYYRYDEQYYGVEDDTKSRRKQVAGRVVGGIAAIAVLLFAVWLGVGFATGKGLPAWMGGSPAEITPTSISVAQALTLAVETEMPSASATPTAVVTATTPPETSALQEDEGKATATLAPPTLTPTFIPTLATPTPGPGLGIPFGAQSEYLLHQVKFGDNLPKLAEQYQTDRDVIVSANGLLPNQSLQPDQVIIIMPERTDSLGVVHLSVLFLDEDVRVADFAASRGVTVEELTQYNDLGAHNTIPAGRWLIFPKRVVIPTAAPTAIPVVNLNLALTAPFGPDNGYVLHQVAPGESVPVLEELYLTSAEVIYAANEIKGSIQAGQVLVMMLEQTDPAGVVRFAVYAVNEAILIDDLAVELGVTSDALLLYNDREAGDTLPAESWVIYPVLDDE